MVFSIKSKIWLTVFSIIVMFSFFTLFYFPAQQEKLLLKNYNNEVQNLANTVALGEKIAIEEQSFAGVQTATEFIKDDPRLKFLSMVAYDTVWSHDHRGFQIKKTIVKTYPENEHPEPNVQSNDSIIVKRSPFITSIMAGEVLLAFTTKEINESQKKIRLTSLIVSGMVLLIGIILGLLLARKISIPVLALRDAANRVGEGDLSQKVKKISNDEIGELAKAFDNMVDGLLKAKKLNEDNQILTSTNITLNNTLSKLKTTQAQLIQSEKMASLGELTAGIAHEIQNPLNFVNNFSEVSAELLDEMEKEFIAGNKDDGIVIASDIKQNLEKIIHHGKRADAIVKGMLQHSRKSTGQKELTDINALADEYLRLSYHGMRAKDQSFNATMQTDFDETIGKIIAVPQDIGRVLLNLFNNAFYSVTEKKNQQGEARLPDGQGYEPVVLVSTKKLNNKIEIRVKDNGSGISQKVMDKIFQPFFTTKPAGQGTGLGLSLSYDIIKAHGGEIKVETKERMFAEFMVSLPYDT